MPHEQTISVTSGGVQRDYQVVFQDDSPERAEAVRFLQQNAECLFPSMAIPHEVTEMPLAEANEFLRRHPIQEQWSSLRIGQESEVRDDDLHRLRYIPELVSVQISSDKITDAGLEHLVHLTALTRLGVYSAGVTDACLRVIRNLRSLRSLDLQSSPNLSRAAVLAAIESMPWLQDAWPPPDPVRLAECRRRYQLSRGAGDEILATPDKTEAETSARALRFVDLSRQPMTQPPPELFATDDIEQLDLIGCGITILPAAIGNLTQLRTLYANWNRLTKLPNELGRLLALEKLWLNDNQLTSIPAAINCLTRLDLLCLDTNRLGRFPKEICELRQLKELRIKANDITELPEALGNLSDLQSLSLGNNRLKKLPASIARLENLTYLGLQGNPLCEIPADVWRLPCLVTLNLGGTGITELPAAAANVPNIIGMPGQRIHC